MCSSLEFFRICHQYSSIYFSIKMYHCLSTCWIVTLCQCGIVCVTCYLNFLNLILYSCTQPGYHIGGICVNWQYLATECLHTITKEVIRVINIPLMVWEEMRCISMHLFMACLLLKNILQPSIRTVHNQEIVFMAYSELHLCSCNILVTL